MPEFELPDDERTLSRIARILVGSGFNSAALRLAERAADLRPAAWRPLAELCEILGRLSEQSDALPMLALRVASLSANSQKSLLKYLVARQNPLVPAVLIAVGEGSPERMLRLTRDTSLDLDGPLLSARRMGFKHPRLAAALLLRAELHERSAAYELADLMSLDAEWMGIGVAAQPVPTTSTLMFRNRPLIEALCSAISLIVERKGVVRVHIGACSTGEEVYSLLTVLHQRGILENVELSASDVQPSCVRRARTGVIERRSAEQVPQDVLDKYFVEQRDGRFRLIQGLLGRAEFSVRDLSSKVENGGRYDVIVANNLLVHFEAVSAAIILANLVGLTEGDGVLCIGGGVQGEIERYLVVGSLFAISNCSAAIFDAWHLQRRAWYSYPRPYWALPPARHFDNATWRRASLFSPDVGIADRLNEELANRIGRQA